MRAVFGLVGLVVVLAIVGMLVKTQLKSVQTLRVAPTAEAASASGGTAPATPKQASQKIADDIARAMDQGAHRRDAAAGGDAEK